ncbi:MAG: NAD(+)/NADH kinase [Candidatus Coatesbacteria bacterium]|nr:NAD(+)/NADH kinase [Candidatus Coatesbacteria bacterium]
MFKTIAIVAKPHAHNIIEILNETCEWLSEQGIKVRVDEQVAHMLASKAESMPREHILIGADMVIVFGGDGTLISVARIAPELSVPILGVNVGGLGFLTEIPLDELFASLSEILDGKFTMEERTVIRARVSGAQRKSKTFFAVNDFVINKSAIARMIDIMTYVDGSFVARYRGDGLIISTPTGSTAYSLAAGGPILQPKTSVLVLSPICPHTLTNRPIVVPDNVQIRNQLLSKVQEVSLTIDGQEVVHLFDGDEVLVFKAMEKMRLIQRVGTDYYSILRHKLSWGKNLDNP